MESILLFAKDASPIGVIALLVIVILQLVRSSGIIGKLRITQVDDTKKVSNKEIIDSIDLSSLNAKLDKIANNHLHELPEMKKTLDRIEATQTKQGERLSGVEMAIKILLKHE